MCLKAWFYRADISQNTNKVNYPQVVPVCPKKADSLATLRLHQMAINIWETGIKHKNRENLE